MSAKSTTKTKMFRIAKEGATTDGRVIERAWLEQMAAAYDRKTYGARVNLEHYRGIDPNGLFKAYGDVLALEVRTEDDGKLGLYAQLEPTDELIALNKAKQKIYTSCEINPSFGDTGKAYLVGLAVTDNPASMARRSWNSPRRTRPRRPSRPRSRPPPTCSRPPPKQRSSWRPPARPACCWPA